MNESIKGFIVLGVVVLLSIFVIAIIYIYFIADLIHEKNDMKHKIENLQKQLTDKKEELDMQELHYTSQIRSLKRVHQEELQQLSVKKESEENDLKAHYEEILVKRDIQIRLLTDQKGELTSKYHALEESFSAIQNKYNRIKNLYPDADN